MRNLLLTIRFDGTAYHGWQVQENSITVQQAFQDAWEKIFSARENVIGCSRTDSGVHADKYCCNVRTVTDMPCPEIVYAMNAVLPNDIAVLSCEETDWDFHARYSAVSKRYEYRIWNSPVKNPFISKYSLQVKYPLDASLMNKNASDFLGTHDFAAFCASGSSVADTVRTVTKAEVSRQGELVTFTVEANGFLYNMVRIMTGTLIDVSSGKIPDGSVPEIINSKCRERAGVTAKPHGLFLADVKYGKE